MAYRTVQQLTTEVLNELSLVPGSSVQTYTEPLIISALNTSFQSLFKMRFWGHLTATTTHDIDDASGLVTDSLSTVEDVEDIHWIREYPYEERDKLRFLDGDEWQTYQSPAFSELPYTDAQRTDKLIRVYPHNIGQPIRLRARRKVPLFTANTDIVPFDFVCIKHYTAMNMLASDGINPNAQQQQAVLFNKRYEDLTHAIASKTSDYSRSTNRYDGFTVAE